MNGSEKQVKWAQEIIASEKSVIEKHLRHSRARVELDSEKLPTLVETLKAQEICCKYVLEGMDKIDNAKTVIDNRAIRYYVLRQVLPALTGEEKEIVKAFLVRMQQQGNANQNDALSRLVG